MVKVVLIPGDGIGPEITDSVLQIFEAANIPIQWVYAKAGLSAVETDGEPIPDETLELIHKYKIALKGPLTTPVGGGYRSVNVHLRKLFNLYSNIRPAKTIQGVPTRFSNIDLVLFRENTQGLYVGMEKWLDDSKTVAESKAIISKEASEKIIRAAFEYAVKEGRKKVTLIHKANILKLTTGLFLETGKEIALNYPQIQFEDIIVDNMAMQLVMRPEKYDVLVTTNLFGDILSDLVSGLVGGLGMTGSANLGDEFAIFEAVHGSAPDIAGKNIANPTAFLFSALMLLRYLNMNKEADTIFSAIEKTIQNKSVCTGDIGGTGTTSTFTKTIISNL